MPAGHVVRCGDGCRLRRLARARRRVVLRHAAGGGAARVGRVDDEGEPGLATGVVPHGHAELPHRLLGAVWRSRCRLKPKLQRGQRHGLRCLPPRLAT
eukprot:1190509-Prorocentrum_minimum.AAC.2